LFRCALPISGVPGIVLLSRRSRGGAGDLSGIKHSHRAVPHMGGERSTE